MRSVKLPSAITSDICLIDVLLQRKGTIANVSTLWLLILSVTPQYNSLHTLLLKGCYTTVRVLLAYSVILKHFPIVSSVRQSRYSVSHLYPQLVTPSSLVHIPWRPLSSPLPHALSKDRKLLHCPLSLLHTWVCPNFLFQLHSCYFL